MIFAEILNIAASRNWISRNASNVSRAGLLVAPHRFTGGFVQTPGASLPFFQSALALTAVKLAKSTVLRDRLDNLVLEPLPNARKRIVAFRLLFGHTVEPRYKSKLPTVTGLYAPSSHRVERRHEQDTYDKLRRYPSQPSERGDSHHTARRI